MDVHSSLVAAFRPMFVNLRREWSERLRMVTTRAEPVLHTETEKWRLRGAEVR